MEDATGWRNLCRILTRSHRDTREKHEPPPKIPLAFVEEHAEGLVCLSGCARQGVRDEPTMRRLLAAFGAEVVMTRSDVGKGHPDYYQDLAVRLARELSAFYVNQFENPANPEIHRKTTAIELWQDTEGKIDILVGGVGTGR